MINHRRISFCGAQGTGKTTLFEAVKNDEMFKGWNFYSEVVRQMLEREEVVINENGNSESQKKIFDAYNEILDKMFDNPSVSDRCIVDVAAYTSRLFDTCNPKDEDYNKLSNEDFRERKEVVRRKYELSLIVYFPIEFPLVEDGVRSIDEQFQKDVDMKIQQFLKNYDIPYITITGSVEERLEQLKKVIFSEK